MHYDVITLYTQNEAIGAHPPPLAVAAPMASFWVRIATYSCMKSGVYHAWILRAAYTNLFQRKWWFSMVLKRSTWFALNILTSIPAIFKRILIHFTGKMPKTSQLTTSWLWCFSRFLFSIISSGSSSLLSVRSTRGGGSRYGEDDLEVMSVGEGDEERAEADLKEAVRWSGISVRVGRSVEDASACFSLLFSVQEINQSGIILAFEKTSGH